MPIKNTEPPAEALALLRDSINRVTGFGRAGKALAVIDRTKLSAAVGHRVYELSAEDIQAGKDLDAAVLIAWRFAILDGQVAVADIELICDPDGTNLQFGSVNSGPLVSGTMEAIRVAEQLPAVKKGSFE